MCRYLVVLVSLVGLAAGQGQVWIVDADGGGDFPLIQAAVNAASDGDLIVIRPRVGQPGHIHPGFTINDKALHVASMRGSRAKTGAIRIAGLSAGKVAAVSRIEVRFTANSAVPGIDIEACAGSVFLSNCIARAQGEQAGVRVTGSSDVTLVDCVLVGGDDAFSPQPGLSASNALVAVYGGSIEGGDATSYFFTGYPGAPGLLLRHGSEALLQAVGIRGGNGDDSCKFSPGDGGPGVRLREGSLAHAMETQPQGGAPGCEYPFCGIDCANPGPGLSVEAGSVWNPLDHPIRRLSSEHTLQLPGTYLLRVDAVPGDQVILATSPLGTLKSQVGRGGFVHLAGGYRGLHLGVVGANGVLAAEVDVPPLPGGRGARRTLGQLNVIDSQGRRRLGAPILIESLDPGFGSVCEMPIHVRAGAAPGGDGASWASAFADLQQAFLAASSRADVCQERNVEIWLAAGTYTPGPPGSARTVRFELPRNVALMGGFAGHETSAAQRDPEANPTILSGDFEGDDGPGFTNRADNAHRVVQFPLLFGNLSRIDGLTIRGGQADVFGYANGAGVYLRSGVLINCRIVDNYAQGYGGGIWAESSAPSWILDCEIRGNRAVQWGGGAALYNRIFVQNCEIVDNEVVGPTGFGGGLTINGSQFSGYGAIDGSLLRGNRAYRGAALRATSSGTGNFGERLRITNSTLYGNHAELEGGGLVFAGGLLDVANSILWGNTGAGIADEAGQLVIQGTTGVFTLHHSCVQGLVSSLGNQNIALDPLLGPDLELLAGSPCIDSGSNALVAPDRMDLDGDLDLLEPVPFDRLGNPRLRDDPAAPDVGEGTPPLVDMGAHERIAGP